VPRWRLRAQRSLYGPEVFDSSMRSVGPSGAPVSRAWGRISGTVLHSDGRLQWRGRDLGVVQEVGADPRRPRVVESFWINPWMDVWSVRLREGWVLEIAVEHRDRNRFRSPPPQES